MKRTVSARQNGVRTVCGLVVAMAMGAAMAAGPMEAPDVQELDAAEPQEPAELVARADTLSEVTVVGRRERHVDVDISRWQEADLAITLIRARERWGGQRELHIPRKRRGLVGDYKFLGYEFDNGGRVTIRKKNGSPTLMYRQQF